MTSPNERVVLVLSVEFLGAADEVLGVGQVEVAADLLHDSIIRKKQIFETWRILEDRDRIDKIRCRIDLINLVGVFVVLAHSQVFSVRRF